MNVGCLIANPQDRTRSARLPKVKVDTDSELTWIKQKHLERIGVEPEKKKLRLITANGGEIVRSIGFAIIRVGEEITIDEVVFAKKSDFQHLGTRALEGMNLKVDLRNKKLVDAGPIVVAGKVIRKDNESFCSRREVL